LSHLSGNPLNISGLHVTSPDFGNFKRKMLVVLYEFFMNFKVFIYAAIATAPAAKRRCVF
jgi:hypothetical protein